jgi:hypothetical protein
LFLFKDFNKAYFLWVESHSIDSPGTWIDVFCIRHLDMVFLGLWHHATQRFPMGKDMIAVTVAIVLQWLVMPPLGGISCRECTMFF